MARAAEFEKAWRLAYTKTDYSLIESLLHRDYQMYDHRMGMKVDFETEKSLIETLSPFLTMGLGKFSMRMRRFMLRGYSPNTKRRNQDIWRSWRQQTSRMESLSMLKLLGRFWTLILAKAKTGTWKTTSD